MRLDPAELESIIRLQRNADFAVFLKAVGKYRGELVHFTLYGQEDSTHTYRGMARSITELLMSVEKAPATLEATRSKK